MHHSAEHLDWLAAHREHPLDTIYTVGLINLPAFLLGFDLSTLAAFTAFRGIWAIYIHSQCALAAWAITHAHRPLQNFITGIMRKNVLRAIMQTSRP